MDETPQLRSNRKSIDNDITEHEFEQLNKHNESIFHESMKGVPSVSNTNKNEDSKRNNNSASNHNPCFKSLTQPTLPRIGSIRRSRFSSIPKKYSKVSDILQGVSKQRKVQNSNEQVGITMTTEERSQHSTISNSRSRSLTQISSSSQHLQIQQQQHQQISLNIVNDYSSSSRKNNNTSSKKKMIEDIIIQEVCSLQEDLQPP